MVWRGQGVEGLVADHLFFSSFLLDGQSLVGKRKDNHGISRESLTKVSSSATLMPWFGSASLFIFLFVIPEPAANRK